MLPTNCRSDAFGRWVAGAIATGAWRSNHAESAQKANRSSLDSRGFGKLLRQAPGIKSSVELTRPRRPPHTRIVTGNQNAHGNCRLLRARIGAGMAQARRVLARAALHR